MFKKLQRNIVFLFMLFIIPLTIGKVDCAWVYYEGAALGTSTNIGITLGKFNYIPYPNEYPSTPEGTKNNEVFDKISGGKVEPNKDFFGNYPMTPTNDGKSLTDPDSPINKALSSDNLPQSKPYITSSDYFDTNGNGRFDRNDTNALDYFYGKDADPNTTFIIVRETYNNPVKQEYTIYTTTVDINKLNVGDDIMYVYKTTLIWTLDFSGSDHLGGNYKISTKGNTQGVCKVKNLDVRNKNNKLVKEKMFDYENFKPTK